MSIPTFFRSFYYLTLATFSLSVIPLLADDDLPKTDYHLEKTFSKKLEIEIETRLPPFHGTLVFPMPSNGPTQNILGCDMVVDVPKGKQKGILSKDVGKHKKPLLRTFVTSKDEGKAIARIQAELYNVKLVEGALPKKTNLTLTERNQFTASEVNYEHAGTEFKAWLKKHQLQRKKDERDLDFAFRLLGFMREEFRYKVVDMAKISEEARDKKITELVLCTQQKLGECWSLSRVYTAVLRANGIPCKHVSGRLILPGQSEHGSPHVKVEAFLDNVGWIPIEVAATVNLRNLPLTKYFGNEGDYMIVLDQGVNYEIQIPNRGIGKVGSFCGFVAWPTEGKWDYSFGKMRIVK